MSQFLVLLLFSIMLTHEVSDILINMYFYMHDRYGKRVRFECRIYELLSQILNFCKKMEERSSLGNTGYIYIYIGGQWKKEKFHQDL